MGISGILKTECSTCGRPRTQVEHFYSYGGKREKRLRSVCKACHAAQGSARVKLNPEKYNERAKNRYKNSIQQRSYGLWYRAKQRAKKLGLEFSISREIVDSWLKTGKCSVTGVPFDLSTDRDNPWSPSLDRINPKIGYTEFNSRLVTWIYNRAKGSGTDEDVINFSRGVISAIDIRKTA